MRLVDLVDSKNSDGTTLTPEQQRSWADQAGNHPGLAIPEAPRPHAVGRRLGPESCADIMRRYAAGESAKALAEDYDVARNAVMNLLRNNGVVVRRQPLPNDLRPLAAADYERGATIAQIASRYGISYGHASTVLTEAGVTKRPRGGNRAQR